MWDDEDNNPYGSFNRRDSETSDIQGGFGHVQTTPPSEPDTPEAATFSEHSTVHGDDDHTGESRPIEPKKGGYDSRIEQILYENRDLEIQIVHAGKNAEGGGYIVYTIRTGEIEVRRRYSEFASLRSTLVALHPTLIIPPIPEKHSMADYAAKPTKAKEDEGIIELRKRMLATFLNRCRKMKDVREDGVWWRFLDPNASWNEVLHSHPVASIPKHNLKAPPLDPANPSPGHQFLPVPSSSAKLRSSAGTSASGTPTASPLAASHASSAAHTTPGPQVFGRFPPDARSLGEAELDPYFVQFESSSKDLEALLQGSLEKTNQRMLTHLFKLSEDVLDLGARFNAFSLSEQSQSVAAAIEKTGQASDTTSLETKELSHNLSAQFAEPMRESAQFAGVVKNVLRYRILKRVQEEMTRDQLDKARSSLESLEKSEQEAKRIQQYLDTAGSPGTTPPRRSASTGSNVGKKPTARDQHPRRAEDDSASIDSDFPPTTGTAHPSASQGLPELDQHHRRTTSSSGGGNFVTNKIFGRITHAFNGALDSDPERARRDQIGKTRESLVQLEQALEVSERDVKDASLGVMKDLKRFQGDKEDDLRKYMMNFARCHIHWAKRSIESWEEAKAEVAKIDVR
ncbi:sorting nexin-like protein-41 [Myriangium duriaei CBS 260.36]|uniref:Sorting nexin-like protein-41 n=1 Tax=Myriangium duriaei CBS 260.36 TaxID=1168546 RepID=A0A9P4IV99_9PEZI|nr:sorting nexin-like protein-41 [Myriangium duriaei CBS 260.36]